MANTQEEMIVRALGKVAEGFAIFAQAGGLDGGGCGGKQGSYQLASACDYLDIGETKFRELIADGKIAKPFKSGGRNQWLREDLDKYLKAVAKTRNESWPQEPPARTASNGSSSPTTASVTRSDSAESPSRRGRKSGGESSF